MFVGKEKRLLVMNLITWIVGLTKKILPHFGLIHYKLGNWSYVVITCLGHA